MGKYNAKSYLSPREMEVVGRLSYEKADIVTLEQFDKYFKFPKNIRQKVLFRLKKKGILTTVKKGVYFYSPLETGPAGRNINEFLIPSILFPKGNYYVGYATMYNYYGFTDQIFQVMYILNTSKQREKNIGGIQFKTVKISANRMYGADKIKIEDAEVIVSDRERTLVDMIYFPDPVGGLKNAFDALKQEVRNKRVDLNKLVKYTAKFPSSSTRKRIAFTLEQAGVSRDDLLVISKSIKNSSLVTLYPSRSRAGKINKEWNLIENASYE